MAGVSAEQATQKIVKLAGTGFPNDFIKTLSAATSFKVLDDDGEKLTSTELVPAHNLLSFLGRINYAYKDRYLFSAAIRADATPTSARTTSGATSPPCRSAGA